jgi:hypothetical protein
VLPDALDGVRMERLDLPTHEIPERLEAGSFQATLTEKTRGPDGSEASPLETSSGGREPDESISLRLRP